MTMLNERFNDTLDELNDSLTDLCEAPFNDLSKVVENVEHADILLRGKGLHIDFTDFEKIKSDIDTVDPDEAITFLVPLYDESHEQSEYNLHVTYFSSTDSESDVYEMDMEVQYVWESEDEDDDFEDEDDFQ